MEDTKTKPFLEELAEDIIESFGDRLDELTFVFPNKRAGLFFQKYLAGKVDSPTWSPAILPMEDFIGSMGSLRKADGPYLVFELFRIYKTLAPGNESFDKFFFWGEMLLADFDSVDKYLADAEMLFLNITQLKKLDTLDYLLPEEVAIIRSFWASFGTERSRHQQEFLSLWEILPEVYSRFRQRLEKQDIGYEGMIQREVAQKAIMGGLSHRYGQVIFVGFNALTRSEEKIMEHFVKNEKALAYWNVDAWYMDNEQQEAGFFLRKHAKNPVFEKTFRKPFPDNLRNQLLQKNIQFTGVPLEVGQAKAMGEQLLRCLELQKGVQLENTAIVLPEEHLLFPALHAIPQYFTDETGNSTEISNINVTMGYPLRNTPLYSLLENLIDLQQSIKANAKAPLFHHRQILSILRHPYIFYYKPLPSGSNIALIEKGNRIYLPANTLEQDDLLYPAIFRHIVAVNDVFDYLLDILMVINKTIDEENYEQPTLEQEYIYQFFTQLKRLRELISQEHVQLSLPVFLKLFRQIIQNLKLPFSGEPLRGLQLMGVLETRNLDFENLFILSANEGSFPPSSGNHSFIPYNLKKGYGLPTRERDDASFAYLFYSMLQRAKNIHIFYNTETGFNINGEMSRFLYQLRYETGLPISRQVLSNPARLAKTLPITIFKTPEVLKIMQKYVVQATGPSSRLTPSALNTYLDCRLRFYYKYVAGINEADEVQEDVNAMVFGNIFHRSMELLYKRFIEKKATSLVKPEDFTMLRQLSTIVIDEAFREQYGEEKEMELEGKNLIVRSVVQKFLMAIIGFDEKYAPFEIVSLEVDDRNDSAADETKGFKMDFPIQAIGDTFSVGLKGIIDRVDRKDGNIRVIDYKTGKDEKNIVSIPSLFDRNDKKRNKAAMQTFFYGMLYHNKYPFEGLQVIPGIYNSKELFSKNFDLRLNLKSGTDGKYYPVNDVVPQLEDFKTHVRSILEELFNPEVPFDQTEDLKKCSYCTYKNICHR